MATFNATFFHVQNRDQNGTAQPTAAGKGAIGTTALTTGAEPLTAQRGGSDWAAPDDGYLQIHCDGAVRVAIGETAAAGASPVGHYLAAESALFVSIREGEHVSVVNV